jgi:hypothetical protein
MAAAMGARTAGIGAEFLAPEEQRRGGLDDLHRRSLDAAGIGRGRETVLAGRAPVPPLVTTEMAKRLRLASRERKVMR